MSALTAAGSTRAWRRLRRYVMARDMGLCQVPIADNRLCLMPAHHVDHIRPRSLFLADDPAVDHPDNLRAACAKHNLAKGDRPERPLNRWSW